MIMVVPGRYLWRILMYICTLPMFKKLCCGSGCGALFDPGTRDGKKPDLGSGIKIPDHISESLLTVLG